MSTAPNNLIEDFPPLPAPAGVWEMHGAIDVFTADQVRSYVLADRARRTVAGSIDTPEFQSIMGDLIDAINDMETSRSFDIAREKLIAHINARLAPAAPIDVSASIHYPECWDTAAYPTVQDAIREIAAFKCSECAPAAPSEIEMTEAQQRAARSLIRWWTMREVCELLSAQLPVPQFTYGNLGETAFEAAPSMNITPDAGQLVALALSGALPDQQTKEILTSAIKGTK